MSPMCLCGFKPIFLTILNHIETWYRLNQKPVKLEKPYVPYVPMWLTSLLFLFFGTT
jgi:hypothetical protein